MDIKSMVSGDKRVKFVRYFNQELWYSTEDGFEFPVPIADIGSATFLAEDRAMLFMRYIRKHISFLEQAKRDSV